MKRILLLILFLLTIMPVMTDSNNVLGQNYGGETGNYDDLNELSDVDPVYKISCGICGLLLSGKDFEIVAKRVEKHMQEDHPDMYYDNKWGDYSEGGEGGQYGHFQDDPGNPSSSYCVPVVDGYQVQKALSAIGVSNTFMDEYNEYITRIGGSLSNLIEVYRLDSFIRTRYLLQNQSLSEALDRNKRFMILYSSSRYDMLPGRGYDYYSVVTNKNFYSSGVYNYDYLYVFD